MIDLYESFVECSFYVNGYHRFLFDADKSAKEESVFSCICGEILSELEDACGGA